jgi:sterol desaturase/sphingolipid hydroxylase (fatty acid hydroxylase superfamily)
MVMPGVTVRSSGSVDAQVFERAVGPVFAVGLFALFTIESIAPLRAARTGRAAHACLNLTWVAAALVTNALVASFLVTRATSYAAHHRWGLLPRLGLDGAAAVVLGLVFLEITGYPLHILKHRVPLLWRLHRVHHGDEDLDVTSAMRFHPLEMILNASWLALSIVLLGVPRTGTALLAFIAVPLSLLQHANLRFPRSVDRCMRWLLVSPAVHQTHHSRKSSDTDSNFGSVFTLADRLFGTFCVVEREDLRFDDAHP